MTGFYDYRVNEIDFVTFDSELLDEENWLFGRTHQELSNGVPMKKIERWEVRLFQVRSRRGHFDLLVT